MYNHTCCVDYTQCTSLYTVSVSGFFCVQSGKNYTGQKKITQAPPVVPVTNIGCELGRSLQVVATVWKSLRTYLKFIHALCSKWLVLARTTYHASGDPGGH